MSPAPIESDGPSETQEELEQARMEQEQMKAEMEQLEQKIEELELKELSESTDQTES